MNQQRIDRIRRVTDERQGGIAVVIEDIHDPHNASAIIRTCDAMGIQDVRFVFERESTYNPRRVGKASSSSANKWLDFTEYASARDCVTDLTAQGYGLIVTALTDTAVSLTDYRVPDGKIAVIFGNEHSGVSQTMLDAATTVIKIPMYGFVQSLNVSVSAGIILWECTRQRKAAGNAWNIPAKDRKKLFATLLDRAKK